MGSKDYQDLIGNRIKQYRINSGMTQQDLEDISGVSVRSISRLEQGASVQFDSLIKILSAFNLDENIALLVPDQSLRPSSFLKKNNKPKQRVRKTTKQGRSFKWGDENI